MPSRYFLYKLLTDTSILILNSKTNYRGIGIKRHQFHSLLELPVFYSSSQHYFQQQFCVESFVSFMLSCFVLHLLVLHFQVQFSMSFGIVF